jgi:translocation and assembly module TamB
MPLGKGQRRILYLLLSALLGLLLLWFSFPWWFPWVLRPVAQRQGVGFAAYQREGYRRFALQNVTLTNASVHFRAARLEAVVPSIWAWRCLVGNRPQPLPFVRIENWQYESVGPRKPGHSVYQDFAELRGTLPKLGYWVPSAVLTNGTVRASGQRVAVPFLVWDRGQARASLELPEHQSVQLATDLQKGPPYTLEVHSEPLHLQAGVRFIFTPQELQIQGTGSWWSNRMELGASFGRNDPWPAKASLQAPEFQLPAALLQLEGYRDLSGSLSAKWEHGEFGLDLRARAQPQAEQVHLPPVRLDLHAYGDTNSVVIRSARVSSPGLQAELSRELQLHFTGPLLREPATLKVTADLAREPWIPLEGQLSGEANFVPTTARLPVTYFHLTGSGVGTAELKARSFRLNGNLNWPWLDITSAKGEFEDGSVASGEGKLELVTESIAGGRFQFSGPLLRRWLPQGYNYETLSLTGAIQGPLKAPAHSGHLEVTRLSSPELQPLQVRLDWSGRKQSIAHAELLASAGNSALAARGALEIGARESTLQMTNLSLATNGGPALELVKPCRVSVSRAPSGNAWQLSMTLFDLAGKGGEAQVQGSLNWPGQGTLRVAMTNISSSLLAGFAQALVPEVQISRFNASANWTNGPANLAVELAATHPPQAAQTAHPRGPPELRSMLSLPLSLELKLAGNQNGLVVSNLVVSSQTAALATAHGKLPLTLNPATPKEFVQIDAQQPLQFEAAAQPKAFFWEELTAWTGVALREPHLKLRVAGTWQAPSGQLDLLAQQIQFQQGPTNLPALKDLQVAVSLDRSKLRLAEGRVFAQGQPVLLTAELPLDERFWNDLKERIRHAGTSAGGDWKAESARYYEQASAHVLIAGAQLAAFSELFPKLLSPEGELSLDLSVLPGLKLDGNLALTRARTRPLGNAGPIRDIEVRMRFVDRALELERASAGVGGTRLMASGSVDLHGSQWLHGGLPPFQFQIHGTNVPLARQPSAIIRSDLHLAIRKTNGAPPLISGIARLRDSYYLTDLAALVPGKVATPQRRPPYFSVEDPMLANWRVGVRVEGTRFLKVLSPLFNGEVSADLNLQGTLKDPMVLGDLKIDSGVVRFPFASFQVRQGLVTLASQDPHRPALLVMGDSRQFGYDLRMDVTGPVDAPVLQFTSTPPLASEQILLMVTAGELPRGELTLTPQQKAQTVAMFLGRDLLSKLGFGDQAESRLSVQTNEEISQVGRPTYNVEYKLSKRWSVEGEYDRFGDFNAGFKWRIYSK